MFVKFSGCMIKYYIQPFKRHQTLNVYKPTPSSNNNNLPYQKHLKLQWEVSVGLDGQNSQKSDKSVKMFITVFLLFLFRLWGQKINEKFLVKKKNKENIKFIQKNF